MDFSLTDSQQAIADLAGQLLDEAKPAGSGQQESTGPWKELARAGLLSLSLPPELGGDGLGVLETAALLTEVGRRAVPVPALATLMTGVLPIVRWGDGGLRRVLLPPAAAGELILTAGIREPSDPMPAIPAATVTDGTVSGTKVGVPYCAQAGRVLVPVSFEDTTGVVIIDPAAPGAHVTRTPAAGPEYTLRLDRVPVEHVLGEAAALALTRDHIATRRQFGRPLAAFQAVAQQIADVYIASRTLHLATQSACWLLDEGKDAAGDLGVAGYWCAEEAPRSVRTCHHLHGGTGMDTTYPLHRLSALIGDLVRYLGGAEYQLEQACSLT